MRLSHLVVSFTGLVLLTHLSACSSSSGTATDVETTADSSSFPSDLAVASPLSYSATGSNLVRGSFLVSSTVESAYEGAVEDIAALLEATDAEDCTFDPDAFLVEESSADCYGPQVLYQNHPEAGVGPASGSLPPGDVGIWTETDESTGNACSAAQMNARMEGIQEKTNMALKVEAAMQCVINTNSLSMPDATTTSVDIMDEMNALGVEGVEFTASTISFDDTTGTYSYHNEFTYLVTGESDSHAIEIDLAHTDGDTDGAYSGTLSYLVTGDGFGGNCPGSTVTFNTSLQYDSRSDTDIAVELRHAQFCGEGADGRVDGGIVDPSDKYNVSTNTDGWGNNFYKIVAEYDPSTLDGNYVFAWQAGPLDEYTRTLNVNVSDSGASGFAFFGFGGDIEDTDGSIEGFICNWAGPGATRTVVEYAQYQEFEVDTVTGAINATTSQITYAPTNDCTYDGTGIFTFDTDGDGSLTGEIMTNPVPNGLAAGIDTDADSITTTEELIEDTGFTLPSL